MRRQAHRRHRRHRDELTSEERATAVGSIPCVLAVATGRIQVLLDRTALQAGPMRPDDLIDAIARAASDAGLDLGPVGPAGAG